MSDSDHTSGSSEHMWSCRHCPGQEFTAAEKDAHRKYHDTLKERERRRPGPRSRASRLPSPPASSVTLFEPIPSSKRRPASPPKGTGGKKVRKERKIKSRKNYDTKQNTSQRYRSG